MDKIKILFIDDERALRLVGERFIKKLGHDVVVAENGAEALKLFKANANCFQLIITDQNMPEMLGLEFAAEAKKVDPSIPIILVTGFADSADLHAAKKLGISEVIHKPYGTDVLAAAIRKALGQK